MFSTSLNKEMHLFKRNYAINSYFTQKLLEKLGFPRKSNSEKRCILSSLSKHVFSGIYNQPKKKNEQFSSTAIIYIRMISLIQWRKNTFTIRKMGSLVFILVSFFVVLEDFLVSLFFGSSRYSTHKLATAWPSSNTRYHNSDPVQKVFSCQLQNT